MKIEFAGMFADRGVVEFIVDDDEISTVVELPFTEAREMAVAVLYNVVGEIRPTRDHLIVESRGLTPEEAKRHQCMYGTIVQRGECCAGNMKTGHRAYFHTCHRVAEHLFAVHKDNVVSVCE